MRLLFFFLFHPTTKEKHVQSCPSTAISVGTISELVCLFIRSFSNVIEDREKANKRDFFLKGDRKKKKEAATPVGSGMSPPGGNVGEEKSDFEIPPSASTRITHAQWANRMFKKGSVSAAWYSFQSAPRRTALHLFLFLYPSLIYLATYLPPSEKWFKCDTHRPFIVLIYCSSLYPHRK